MKFNVFVALAALAFPVSTVVSAPVGFDRRDLTPPETYVARDFAHDPPEYFDGELKAREADLDDVQVYARDPLGGFRRRRRCGSHRRVVE